MSHTENEDRAERGRAALEAHARRQGTTDEPVEDAMTDLLVDLMHLCDHSRSP